MMRQTLLPRFSIAACSALLGTLTGLLALSACRNSLTGSSGPPEDPAPPEATAVATASPPVAPPTSVVTLPTPIVEVTAFKPALSTPVPLPSCPGRPDRTARSLQELADKGLLQKVDRGALPPAFVSKSWKFATTDGQRGGNFGRISTSLEETNGGHEGVDIGGAGGATIRAIGAGRVVYSETRCKEGMDKWCGNGWGNHIVIDHGNQGFSRYAHLRSLVVSDGAQVTAGQKIGEMGTSGLSDGVHLHLEIGALAALPDVCKGPFSFSRVYDYAKLNLSM